MEKRLSQIIMWIAALSCLGAALYIGINRTLLIFAPHNYLFAPLGDDALDAVSLLYPIMLGQKGVGGLFQPYADHRLVIERLWGIYDFFFSQGTQSGHPYRLAGSLWIGYFLFVLPCVFFNKQFEWPVKIVLASIYLCLIFASTTLINYGSSIMNTWPYVLIFTLMAFIVTAMYCQEMQKSQRSNIKLYSYMLLAFLFVVLTCYAFGAGLTLWPIIFLVLFKRRAFKKHWFVWLALAVINYILYTYDGWKALATQYGMQTLKQGHFVPFILYYARLVSIPVIPNAMGTASIQTLVIAIFTICAGVLCGLYFLRKKEWSMADTIIFPYFLFGFLTTFAISLSRFWMEFEAINVAFRFAIVNYIAIICMLAVCYSVAGRLREGQLVVKAGISMLAMVWLIAFFIPGDMDANGSAGIFDAGLWNQFLIQEATGVPIDAGFIAEIKKWQNEQDIPALNFLNDTQKKLKKGTYSFWAAQYMNESLQRLHFKQVACDAKANIVTGTDFRANHNPGLFIDINMDHYNEMVNNNWYAFLTNSDDKIVGFGVSAFSFPVAKPTQVISFKNIMGATVRFTANKPYFPDPALHHWWRNNIEKVPVQIRLFWRSAINTALLKKDKTVNVWIADSANQRICKVSQLKV